MAEKAAHGFGGSKESQAQKDCKFGRGNETQAQLDACHGSGKETQAQLDSLAAHQFGGSEESKDQRAARLESGFRNDNMIPFPQARVLSIIKRKKTIDLDALYKALKKQHNRDKNEKREFIKFRTLSEKFIKRGGKFPKWVRDNVIVGGNHIGKNKKTLTWRNK